MVLDTSKLTVNEIKAELKKRGIKASGKKADLVEKLNEAIEDELLDSSADLTEDKQQNKVPDNKDTLKESKPTTPASTTPIKSTSSPIILTDSPVKTTISEDEKRRLRAEKFKTAYKPTKEATNKLKDEEKEKRRKRAERFGIETKEILLDKKQKRAERFGTSDKEVEALKKKKREERFSKVSTTV